MFNVYKSNKMENLVEAFCAILKTPPQNPMTPEWVGIQSRGMKQWLSTRIAQKFGVCTNMSFFFPRQILEIIFGLCIAAEDQKNVIYEDTLFWDIMHVLDSMVSDPLFSSLNQYIQEDDNGKKRYQLCMKMAKIFDDYQVYRPEMLLGWQSRKKGTYPKTAAHAWQVKVWQKLSKKEQGSYIHQKIDLLLKHLSLNNIDQNNLPGRLFLFGISALPKSFLSVFDAISNHLDIHFFILTPSDQYFFDLKSPQQMGKLALEKGGGENLDPLYEVLSNPLLSCFGKAGIQFHSLLENLDYHEPVSALFSDPLADSETMLSFLQSDILNLVLRKKGQADEPFPISETDHSISIHSCHSPMREVQVLKDLLLDLFDKDPEQHPHDVIVMMPDIEAYAPYIETVFSSEHKIAYTISDRYKKSESDTIEAFLKILDLRYGRLEQKEVLDLLVCPSIATNFDITQDDIRMIEKMASDANIFWAKDINHRKNMDFPAYGENTWQFGFARLFMGYAMPENTTHIVNGILPCESFEGLEAEVLGKFAFFCDTLFSNLDRMAGPKSMSQWCEVFQNIVFSMLQRDFSSQEDMTFLLQTIDAVNEDVKVSFFEGNILCDVAVDVLESKLDQHISQGSFLAGSVTFCNLMPMRSIPFKVVALMGMNEDAFPRKTVGTSFDLIKQFPQPQDKLDRDEDTYLFLESLLSARSNFIITYTGKSIKDNSDIPPSCVVSGLYDVILQSFELPKEYELFISHPLHPFSDNYYKANTPFFSFSGNNCAIANILAQNNNKTESFISQDFIMDTGQISQAVTLEDLARFFKNPIQYYLQNTMGIHLLEIQEVQEDREPSAIKGLEGYKMGSFFLEQEESEKDNGDFYDIFKAWGRLPLGEKGKMEFHQLRDDMDPFIQAKKDYCQKRALAPCPIDTLVQGVRITGNIR
ncbi:MAG: exodeoxyribonuclease V subunit gamma, partial [Desulfobacteraceae bacterium]|nr:exodeoxyribonuclease V subunit gamma [Desulfobacteraceae bacterium]